MEALRTKSVSDLKRIAKANNVSLAGCLEKADIVNRLSGVKGLKVEAAEAPKKEARQEECQQKDPVARLAEIPPKYLEMLKGMSVAELRKIAERTGAPKTAMVAVKEEVILAIYSVQEGRSAVGKEYLSYMSKQASLEKAKAAKEEESKQPPPEPESELAALPVSQLKMFARGMGIDVSECLEKSEIIKKLEGRDKQRVDITAEVEEREAKAKKEEEERLKKEAEEEKVRKIIEQRDREKDEVERKKKEHEERIRKVDEMKAERSRTGRKRQRRRVSTVSPSTSSSSSSQPKEGKKKRPRGTDELQDTLRKYSMQRLQKISSMLGVDLTHHTTNAALIDDMMRKVDALDITKVIDKLPPATPPPPLESDTPSEVDEPVNVTLKGHGRDEGSQGGLRLQYSVKDKVGVRFTTHNRRGRAHDVGPCGTVGRFKQLHLISEGTYGKVWKVYDRVERVAKALKQIKTDGETEGVPETALKEIEKLELLTHPNIVNMQQIVTSPAGGIFLVMEYCEQDLAHINESGYKWSVGETKLIMKDLFEGLRFAHSVYIIHRDIKCANLLYDNKHKVLKICDFGCARSCGASSVLTPGMCTLWYRSPELLLSRPYNFPSDVWSTGVVLGDLLTAKPFLPGKDATSQLTLIYQLIGNPADGSSGSIDGLAAAHDPAGVSLIKRLLSFDPTSRPTAATALQDPFLADPIEREKMPRFPSTDGQLTLTRRRKRKARNDAIRERM
eukprot:TRINITY_DN4651_c0_g1_i1.p1 TRINITY_DN4651_c0_g1~~TRINITY_DN4651_c0_g1_i1.p1  ORF type:complete len:730 (+),score=236.69 TRINITY_DN4651_c0_g1_i1:1805-3994(+)